MAYRIKGHSTEFCSCNATCPCAFGLAPDHGRCNGVFAFHVESGHANEVDLANTYVVLAASFGPGPWTAGGFQAALVFDTNGTPAQRDALKQIFTGKMGGDAAGLAGLVGDLKGIFEAPVSYRHHDGHVTVSAGNLVQAEGKTIRAANGEEVWIKNAIYPVPEVRAGQSSKVKVNVPGLSYEPPDAAGFWTGPFDMKG
jgi:hypothetical protein